MARNDQIRVQPKVSVNTKPSQISSRNVRPTPASIPVETAATIPVTSNPITYNAGKPILFNNNNCKPTAAKTKSGNRDIVQTNDKPQGRNHTAAVSNKRHKLTIIVPHSGQNGKLSTTVATSNVRIEPYSDDAEELFSIITDLKTNSNHSVQIDSDKPTNNVTAVQENGQTDYNVTNPEFFYSCKEFTITRVSKWIGTGWKTLMQFLESTFKNTLSIIFR